MKFDLTQAEFDPSDLSPYLISTLHYSFTCQL